MGQRFILHYVLDNPDNGKIVTFEFDESIDYEKYNTTILEIYGKRIKKRYVLNCESGEIMSLKKLRCIMQVDTNINDVKEGDKNNEQTNS